MHYNRFVKIDNEQVEFIKNNNIQVQITKEQKIKRADYCKIFDFKTYMEYFAPYMGAYIYAFKVEENSLPEYEPQSVVFIKPVFEKILYKWRNGENGISYYEYS